MRVILILTAFYIRHPDMSPGMSPCFYTPYRVYLAAACTPSYARPAPAAPGSTIIIAISVHAVAPVPTRIRKNRVFSF
jgi:hypothetical protein